MQISWNRYTVNQLVFSILFGVVLFFCYDEVISWWYGRAMAKDSYYSHAVLIPFISGYFIWRKMPIIRDMESEGSLWGLAVVLFACLLHIAGTVLYVFSLSGFSMFFLAIGVSLFIFGRKITKEILFPLLFLVFMFPLPMAFLNTISLPLKSLVAKTGSEIIRLFGISLYREGFYITIPAGTLLVGNPCSGLRSIISFLALGAVFAYILKASFPKKIFLFALSVPIALISNIIRVPMLILIAHFKGIDAAQPGNFIHDATGIFVFILGLGLLFLTGHMITENGQEK